MHDCLVIGAGPAGLSAATYLARFRRDVLCVEAGPSRAEQIPASHNLAGYPHGIAGAELLRRMREQAARHGVVPRQARVESLRAIPGGFEAVAGGALVHASQVVLASGIVDKFPDFPGLHDAAVRDSVRWCPICDGYEVMDQDVAVIGPPTLAIGHALFLRTYTRSIALLALPDAAGLDAAQVETLQAAGIELVTEAATSAHPGEGGGIGIAFAGGARRRFDALYPMQGCKVHAGLARAVGARCDDSGALVVDAHLATSVPGLYAIGDVVNVINQISVAFGHAAIAATAIHSTLPRNFR